MSEKENVLMAKYGYWGSQERFPVEDWKYEVECDATRQGYWEWVAEQIENEKTLLA